MYGKKKEKKAISRKPKIMAIKCHAGFPRSQYRGTLQVVLSIKTKQGKPLIKNELFFFPVGEFSSFSISNITHAGISPDPARSLSALGAD